MRTGDQETMRPGDQQARTQVLQYHHKAGQQKQEVLKNLLVDAEAGPEG